MWTLVGDSVNDGSYAVSGIACFGTCAEGNLLRREQATIGSMTNFVRILIIRCVPGFRSFRVVELCLCVVGMRWHVLVEILQKVSFAN